MNTLSMDEISIIIRYLPISDVLNIFSLNEAFYTHDIDWLWKCLLERDYTLYSQKKDETNKRTYRRYHMFDRLLSSVYPLYKKDIGDICDIYKFVEDIGKHRTCLGITLNALVCVIAITKCNLEYYTKLIDHGIIGSDYINCIFTLRNNFSYRCTSYDPAIKSMMKRTDELYTSNIRDIVINRLKYELMTDKKIEKMSRMKGYIIIWREGTIKYIPTTHDLSILREVQDVVSISRITSSKYSCIDILYKKDLEYRQMIENT